MSPVKHISYIRIVNVKGIGDKKLYVDSYGNKPTILVAPNGFGKSSVAAGFASLQRDKIKLSEQAYHRDDEKNLPLIVVDCELDDGTKHSLKADATSNDISKVFDVFVINNQLIPKTKQFQMGGRSVATSSLEVSPVVLIPRIPEKAKLAYSLASARGRFGANAKVLDSIEDMIKSERLIVRIHDSVDFSKATQARSVKAVAELKAGIAAALGSADAIRSSIPTTKLDAVLTLAHITSIVEAIISEGFGKSSVENVLAAIQISELHDSDKEQFKKVAARYSYELDKSRLIESFDAIKTTWKEIKPTEDKKKGLIVTFPPASKISNGERDTISFFSLLLLARIKLKKPNVILIVDELFDYLDDANLIAAQYHLSQMMTQFKDEGRRIFPLILTHLDPIYFGTFVFKSKRVSYLDSSPSAPSRIVESVIIKRSDPSIDEAISKSFLHYHPSNEDLSTEFAALGLDANIASSSAFSSYVFAELEKYLLGKHYDPISVCCAVRLMVEEWAYKALPIAEQPHLLTTNKTRPKLDLVGEHGKDVPEVFYLLGVIYNEAMHLSQRNDNFSPLRSKLSNKTIKQMILWSANYCGY